MALLVNITLKKGASMINGEEGFFWVWLLDNLIGMVFWTTFWLSGVAVGVILENYRRDRGENEGNLPEEEDVG